jgi:hypothetical protein
MKYFLFLGLLIPFLANAGGREAVNEDSLAKTHKELMSRSRNFSGSLVPGQRSLGAINKRVEQTQTKLDRLSKSLDTSVLKSKMNIYLEDSTFYQPIIQKADSLLAELQAREKVYKKLTSALSDQWMEENATEMNKVEWILKTATQNSSKIQKNLAKLRNALKEMRE